jgi:hypothetical protein
MNLDEAISVISNDKPMDYNGKFNTTRELIFLKKAKDILKIK